MTVGGAKGAVTMAIAFTIPVLTAAGQPFPGRTILIFIAGGVVVVTLILANFLLPLLMPKSLKAKARHQEIINQDLDIITIEVLRKVIEELNSMADAKSRNAISEVIATYSKRIQLIKKQNNINDELNKEYRRRAFQIERKFVYKLLNERNAKPNLVYKYLRSLSRKEDLLEHHTSFT